MDWAVNNFYRVKPKKQRGKATYYRKRTPADSALDPKKSLASQFESLRVADPERYPAFFDFRGHRYTINIRKSDLKK
jgi:methionyl-tRNA formyltransferase